MNKNELTQEYVRSLFDYDENTGVLTWKFRPREHFKTKSSWCSINARNAGKPLTAKHGPFGHIATCLNGRTVMAHRLIWMMHYGEWPKVIDHIDGNPANNRLSNLRNVTQGVNSRNCKLSKANESGVAGVRFRKDNKKWCAYINAGNKRVYLGTFDTFDSAVAARKIAEIGNGYHENHGRTAVAG